MNGAGCCQGSHLLLALFEMEQNVTVDQGWAGRLETGEEAWLRFIWKRGTESVLDGASGDGARALWRRASRFGEQCQGAL